MVGGPLGALVGVAVGHNLDQGLLKIGLGETAARNDKKAHEIFFRVAFQLMGHIAKADGRVSELEIATTRAIMDHLRLNAEQRQAAMVNFNAGKKPDFPLETSIEALQQTGLNRLNALQKLLEMQFNVAYADGSLHPKTHARLLVIAEQMGVSRLQFEALHQLFRAQHQWSRQQQTHGHADYSGGYQHYRHGPRPSTPIHSLEEVYQVLGVTRDASIDTIKLAYRRLIKQHHPDKFSAADASPAEIRKATEKTREITAAYERIREARGF